MRHPHWNSKQLWAAAPGFSHWHCRSYAEGSGFVTGSRDDTALIATDDNRFASQVGIITLFDGCIKGIHVDVQNCSSALRCHGDLSKSFPGKL
jgi:hypothetical protein